MKIKPIIFSLFIFWLGVVGLQAQSIEPIVVKTTAKDGLALVGDYYMASSGGPAVLLLHELYTDRTSWSALISPLLGAGYNVLNVDLRGYGATGGEISWPKALGDVQTWLDWLKTEGNINGPISVIGSSMGANLAIVGCAQDQVCATSVTLSPGWRYFGIGVETALNRFYGDRPILVIYAERDRWPALGVPLMQKTATNPFQTIVYKGNAHGIQLFNQEYDAITAQIIAWLDAHGR